MTRDQETLLTHLDAEIEIVEKQLRVVQIKKQIAGIELDIAGLQQSLQQQLEGVPVGSNY
jgi:hypothetical protein